MGSEMNDRVRTGSEPLALVMDLGGSWIRVALAIRSGHLLWHERMPTNAEEGGTAVISRVDALLQRGISRAEDRRIVGIGIAIAGPVDPETGIIYSPPHIPGLDGVSFKSLWGKRWDWPLLVGNDATLAALGEYHYGSGSGAHTLVYITISTGIGGGMVVNGRPLMGAHGMAGELGHMTVDRNGPRCKCGNIGCLEAIASGTSIAEAAQRRVQDVGPSHASPLLMMDMASGEMDRISAAMVFEAAKKGDSLSQEILEDVARAVGAGLVNILHAFNPDIIVIGRAVSHNWDYLWPGVQSYIEPHAMSHIRKLGFKLAVSSLGDDIGLLGAAALVWQGQ